MTESFIYSHFEFTIVLSKLIPSASKYEKEITVLDIVKSAERNGKNLDVAFYGQIDGWVHDWARKRGHKVSQSGKDLAIFVDHRMNEDFLIREKNRHRMVAAIFPSNGAGRLPAIIGRGISRKAMLDEGRLMRAGGEVRSIFYGLWRAAFFGFEELSLPRYELSTVIWMFAFLVLLVSATFPIDDLLRHAKAYEYGYDYGKLYAYSWGFSFDPYFLFDSFAAFLDSHLGDAGLKVMQLLCFIIFSAGFFLHSRDWDDRLRALVFVLLLLILGGRITLARPAVFEAFFFILALSLSGAPAVLFGIFMGIFYYLFPLFLIPLAFAKREYAISLVISLLFWFFLVGTPYFTDIITFFTLIITNRAMPISENASILVVLASPFFLILLYLFLKSGRSPYTVPIALFTLINQVRFIDVIAPLLAISLLPKKIGLGKMRFGALESIFFIGILIASLSMAFPSNNLDGVQIKNASVLCDSMECMFNTVYMSENITISPSMEVGFTDMAVQMQMKGMAQNGTIDCGFFKMYGYDVLVEKSLKQAPPCLNLIGVDREYRIWKIIR